jgi:hypothetical protein
VGKYIARFGLTVLIGGGMLIMAGIQTWWGLPLAAWLAYSISSSLERIGI